MTELDTAGGTNMRGREGADLASGGGRQVAGSSTPAWWILARRDLAELWLGGRLDRKSVV